MDATNATSGHEIIGSLVKFNANCEPVTLPLSVPFVFVVPHVPDTIEPFCVIVRRRTHPARLGLPGHVFANHVPVTSPDAEGAPAGPHEHVSNSAMPIS